MATVYRDVEVEVDLSDFDSDEMIDELIDRGDIPEEFRRLGMDHYDPTARDELIFRIRTALYRGEDLKGPVENFLKFEGYIV